MLFAGWMGDAYHFRCMRFVAFVGGKWVILISGNGKARMERNVKLFLERMGSVPSKQAARLLAWLALRAS